MSAHGASLLELVLVLGLMGLLGGLAANAIPAGSPALTAVQGELKASVEQAFLLARARGRSVKVALDGQGQADGEPPGGDLPPLVLPLILPRGVRWGLPRPDIPLPPGMRRTVQAHLRGCGNPCLTVTPRRTAEANVWFLTDGQDAVCLRLSDQGRFRLLRWRHLTRQWRRV